MGECSKCSVRDSGERRTCIVSSNDERVSILPAGDPRICGTSALSATTDLSALYERAAATEAANDTLARAVDAAADLPAPLADALLDATRAAFAGGMHVAAAVSAAVLAGVVVLVATQLRHVRPSGAAGANEVAGNRRSAER